jgi:hypothetical protein
MSATATLNAPKSEVDALMVEAADKAGYAIHTFYLLKIYPHFSLELGMEMPSAASTPIPTSSKASVAENDELAKRLAALRQA